MHLLHLPEWASKLGKRGLGILAAMLAVLMFPASALAAGGENIRLVFSQADYIYLGISLAFGVLAIAVAFGLTAKLKAASPGSESMQRVGAAIYDGAMAYLRQQVKTMSVFVLLIGGLLFFMYLNHYGPVLAAATALCFVAGVAASYTAGYVGMKMAVQANMRTAHAALTSYSTSLQIAFRSGAVAGLITVGMGLVGATLIFLIFRADAMKLLVGFGFGGSLAALFMRVGGGIYTKAADVGADLVGKVEAGIPEDDPRNPAVIADNVGDNVGDCAGMAADVFESYEVTLVAAIILGAATATLFDTATWTKLVMFALMARGAGIIASIIGIFSVKAQDTGELDPLKPITKGFNLSLATAAALTAGLAWFMMGGYGTPITANILTTSAEAARKDVGIVRETQNRLAAASNVPVPFVSMQSLFNDAELKKSIPIDGARQEAIMQLMGNTPRSEEKLEGFTRVEFSDTENPILALAVPAKTPANTPPMGAPTQAVTFKDRWEREKLTVWKVTLTQPGRPEPTTVFIGPDPAEEGKKALDEALTRVSAGGGKAEIAGTYDVAFYANSNKDVAVAIKDNKGEVALSQGSTISLTQANLSYFKVSAAEYNKQLGAIEEETKALEKQREDLNKKLEAATKAKNQAEQDKLTAELSTLGPKIQSPQPVQPQTVRVQEKVVEWWRFVLCIVFGIVMALAFERLTDYYVSMHRRPVREVASVATAGPAPMIITGFAYGKESSVFSVFAIVACLIGPLLIFPPNEFGGYILSFYGIALVGLGLLTTTGYILAMDTFGPISDNAQGVYEMSGEGHDNATAARSVQLLDAAGNTTKALTKGFAIATAVVAAVALFHAFVEAGKLTSVGMRLEVPEIFLGLLIGGAAPYLFSAFSINAVGRAAFQLINEVRSQFKAKPGIMEGTETPDYGRCVAIVTAAAQKELLGPGILAIAFPVFVAFAFNIGKDPVIINGNPYNLVGAQALGGFLAGTILSGQLMAVLLANSGGMWDNCKKLIEDGMFGGKGTDAHKAAVVCDTVGDPFKDTAGPALNPLIKVMNLVALLVAPLVILPLEQWIYWVVAGVALFGIVFAIVQSKKGSMSDGLGSIDSGPEAPKA